MPISALGGSIIGIDATYYLEQIQQKEPLLPALGGFPLALESRIFKELDALKVVGVKPHFVFDGLDYGIDDDPFGPSAASALKNVTAFDTYEKNMAPQAMQVFKTSGNPTPAALAEFLKRTLHKHGVLFTVAPYSALAQLAYLEKHPRQFVDTIYGPSELFLYGVDKLITKLNFPHRPLDGPEKVNGKSTSHFSSEDSEFSWVDRRTCLEELGHLPAEVFIDSLLLAGSRYLPSFPPLKGTNKGYTIRDVATLVAGSGCSVVSLCNQYPDDASIQHLDYVDRYKRAVTSIRHHVVITMEGDIEPLDKANAPSDVHDCLGQRLPEELSMYLSCGLIRPRVLNWLASGKILIPAPYDGGDSKVYQDLVRKDLEPMRRQALSLLADSLNRYYQRKEISTSYWYDLTDVERVNIKDLLPTPKDSLASWNLKEEDVLNRQQALNKEAPNLALGSLSFAVRSLRDSRFAARTVTRPSKDGRKLLKSRAEICMNAVWRFLQLRGYVDVNHQLTSWGRILDGVLPILGSDAGQEKAAFLAIELLRVGLLNADTMFSQYSGAPVHGNDIDKRNCMLVSRVACLGRLIHPARGYSGPLSRHLLAYYSIVSAMQATLRDLVEMSAVTMFLEGYVDRERADWMDIALALPLFNEDSCALGVVTLTYLDYLCSRGDPTSETAREETKDRTQSWAKHCNFDASQQQAFQLWDAVCQGVKLAAAEGEKIKDSDMWDDVDQWLSQRR
ncbi:MAG: hypothetical protein LQ352_000162 [Teloschistes flavicans]|nr:MAG: hypothetical protein LQ352_000162 [Teloschistes flavicans]